MAQPRPDVTLWIPGDSVPADAPFPLMIEGSTPAHRGIAVPPAIADSALGDLEMLSRSDVYTYTWGRRVRARPRLVHREDLDSRLGSDSPVPSRCTDAGAAYDRPAGKMPHPHRRNSLRYGCGHARQDPPGDDAYGCVSECTAWKTVAFARIHRSTIVQPDLIEAVHHRCDGDSVIRLENGRRARRESKPPGEPAAQLKTGTS